MAGSIDLLPPKLKTFEAVLEVQVRGRGPGRWMGWRRNGAVVGNLQ